MSNEGMASKSRVVSFHLLTFVWSRYTIVKIVYLALKKLTMHYAKNHEEMDSFALAVLTIMCISHTHKPLNFPTGFSVFVWEYHLNKLSFKWKRIEAGISSCLTTRVILRCTKTYFHHPICSTISLNVDLNPIILIPHPGTHQTFREYNRTGFLLSSATGASLPDLWPAADTKSTL